MSANRERDGWLLVETTPPSPRYRVLLLPGLFGSDLVFTKILLDKSLMERGIKLLAGNPPGFKGLEIPENFDFSIESYAGLVERIADLEIIDLIVGHSYSGNILIEVAARNNFRGKIMIISPSLERCAETEDLRKLDKYSRKPIMSGLAWIIAYATMKSAFSSYFDDPDLLNAITSDATKIPRSYARNTLISYFDHIDKYGNLARRLTMTKVPIYYIRGNEDDVGFSKENRTILESNGLIKIFDIPGARHFVMIDRPEDVTNLIIELLR